MTHFPDLSKAEAVAVDTETTGLNWHLDDKMFSFAVSVLNGPDLYFDIRHTPKAMDWLRDQAEHWISNDRTQVVNHNLKFDIHMINREGIDLTRVPYKRLHCTTIRAALIYEHYKEYNLDILTKKYLGVGKYGDIYQELADLFGGKATRSVQALNFARAPIEIMERYAKVDTRRALELWEKQNELIEEQNLHDVVELEKRLFPHIVRMERGGVRVSPDEAERQIFLLEEKIDRLRKEIDRIAGFPVNPNPSGSIKKLFAPKQDDKGDWYAVDGTRLSKTKSGAASLGKDALERIRHPAAQKILLCRKFMKAKDTFINGHILGHMAQRGSDYYVHPNINQTKSDGDGGTGTGRLSYTRPALQQIPSRDREIAEVVRPIFRPDPGQGWSYADAEQQEFRIFAHYANPPAVIEGYRKDDYMDMHGMVAELTGLPRKAPASGGANAKQLNLGMVFNMGSGVLAEQMGLPFVEEMVDFRDGRGEVPILKGGPEALAVIDNYHKMVPGIAEVTKKIRAVAKSRGYVRTMYGRHIRFPGGQFTHKAPGLVYQGTSADIMKLNIIRTCEYLESQAEDSRLLLVIHDEENISMPTDLGEKRTVEFLRGLKDTMEDYPDLRVPIRYDWSKPCETWWDANNAEDLTRY